MPLCRTCGTKNPGNARFCLSCGTPLTGDAVDAPRELRKVVTVLFCDLAGSTSLGERLDAEPLRRVLSRYYEAMREAVERHGGSVEKFIGDAVMAVFGVPVAHEDDAVRAVRAAADMRDALPALNEELEDRWGARLQTRIGVNTGEVVAGDASRGEAFVVGDVVNVAARLEQAAPAGEVLLGRTTRALVRRAVEAEPVAPLTLKGKADPVPAFRLVTVAGTAATRVGAFSSPMVGRDAELEMLMASFERCIQTRSCVAVATTGPAGVGKSRITHEFTQALGARARVVRGRCLPYGEGITFWPIAEVVREATGIGDGLSRADLRKRIHRVVARDPDAGRIVDRVAGAIGLSDPAAERDETFWAIRRFLENLAADRPLIVVIDDIHWAETTLLDLVEHIAATSRGVPLLLLCTARSELREVRPGLAGDDAVATVMALGPLDEAATRSLIVNLLDGAALDEAVTGHIERAAEGNPLFVEELLRMLVDDGGIEMRGGRWRAVAPLSPIAVPPTIEALLRARLDRLPRSACALVERAAVIGQEFSVGAVAELSPEQARPQLDATLQSLVKKELLRRRPGRTTDEPSFSFAHLLIRDVAYGGLLKESRADLHERYATWLESAAGAQRGEYEEIIGYHLEQAYGYRLSLGPPDARTRTLAQRAYDRLVPAGRRALARGDMPAAASLLERGSSLRIESPRSRLETLLDLATALSEAGALERANDVVSEATACAASIAEQRLEAHARLGRAWLRTFTDPELGTGELIGVAEEAIAVFEAAEDDAGLASAWHLVGQEHFTACHCARATEALERALVHARRASDRGREAEILNAIVTAYYYGPTPAAEAIRRCRAILVDAGGRQRIIASALNALAGLEAMGGCLERARALYAQGRVVGAEFGAKVGMAAMALFSGDVEMLAGNPEAAERELRGSHAILVDIGETGLLSTVAAQLAETIAEQGRLDEAERFTEESEAAAAPGDVFSEVAWRATRAKVSARRGALRVGEELAREAVRLSRTGDALNLSAAASMALGETLIAADRRDDAQAAYQAAARLYAQKGNVVSAERARASLALPAIADSRQD
jgi:class 3 adenylate cyclase/tetratricopeptide (TPR) repeat protein